MKVQRWVPEELDGWYKKIDFKDGWYKEIDFKDAPDAIKQAFHHINGDTVFFQCRDVISQLFGQTHNYLIKVDHGKDLVLCTAKPRALLIRYNVSFAQRHFEELFDHAKVREFLYRDFARTDALEDELQTKKAESASRASEISNLEESIVQWNLISRLQEKQSNVIIADLKARIQNSAK